MAIIREQKTLAQILQVSVMTIWRYHAAGIPHSRKGMIYYYDTKEVSDWLKTSKRRAHLADALSKYNQD